MSGAKEPVPPAWQEGGPSYSSGLSYQTARKMIDAAMEEAAKQGLRMAVAVVDAGGGLIAFGRMDDSMLAAIDIAIDKARTAAFGKLPTQIWRNIVQSGAIPPLFFHDRWTAFPGGFPLLRDNRILGGIGASGATGYGDVSSARAGLLAAGFDPGEADDFLNDTMED